MYQEDQVNPEEEQTPAEESMENAPEEEQAPAEESMDEAPVEEAAAAGAAVPPGEEPPEEGEPEEGGSRTWLWIALAVIGVLIVILGYLWLRPSEEPTQKLGLSLSTLNNPFFVTLKEGAEEAADEAGVELIVVDSLGRSGQGSHQYRRPDPAGSGCHPGQSNRCGCGGAFDPEG